MSERDICERLLEGTHIRDDIWANPTPLANEAAATIRALRDTLRRADALLAEGAGVDDGAEDWRARVRAFLEERS